MKNPLHWSSRPETAWTTVNAAENIPGVMTPLGASFWLDLVELGVRRSFMALGVLGRDDVRTTDPPDQRVTAAFFGRFALNVDTFRRLSDLTPGASGRANEESLFGSVRDLPAAKLPLWRYLFVAARVPVLVAGLPRRVRSQAAETHRWWRAMTTDPAIRRARPGTGWWRQATARIR